MTTILLFLSTIFLLIAPVTYALSIIRGNTRPHRLTRLALMAELLLTFASTIGAGANPGVLLISGISAAHGVTNFGLSLWRGVGGGKNAFDWACFLISVAGLIVWQISGNALTGLGFAIFADFMAYLPAYVKTWKHPTSENHWFYTFSIIGALLTLLAYPLEAASAFPIYIILCCVVMLFCIYHARLAQMVRSLHV